ncbi:hypothetical protein NDU88_005654 [Pleurodeles waltl]|uniref:Uncharacterized protein n=1 Tax=Pleurodeles waltl TaxID=8319 RepID=A0AAV7TVD7_PLEWA|nr:hypothetical protein NDU88_005654 [Pleurodeles waltl]
MPSPRSPKLFKTPRAPSGCVADDIDILIEEVEALLTKKDKEPQKSLTNGSLSTFLKLCDKGKTLISDVIARPMPCQSKGAPHGASLTVEETPARSVIVHEVPCSNRFSALESLGSNDDLGVFNDQATSQYSTFPTQKDLLTLVVELKEEVKDLKSFLAEVLSLLRSKSIPMELCNPNNHEPPIKTRPYKAPVPGKIKEKSLLQPLSASAQANSFLPPGQSSSCVPTLAHPKHIRVVTSTQNAFQSRDYDHSIVQGSTRSNRYQRRRDVSKKQSHTLDPAHSSMLLCNTLRHNLCSAISLIGRPI